MHIEAETTSVPNKSMNNNERRSCSFQSGYVGTQYSYGFITKGLTQ